jgi:hypothetical protein
VYDCLLTTQKWSWIRLYLRRLSSSNDRAHRIKGFSLRSTKGTVKSTHADDTRKKLMISLNTCKFKFKMFYTLHLHLLKLKHCTVSHSYSLLWLLLRWVWMFPHNHMNLHNKAIICYKPQHSLYIMVFLERNVNCVRRKINSSLQWGADLL